jgi:hypothetical protein
MIGILQAAISGVLLGFGVGAGLFEMWTPCHWIKMPNGIQLPCPLSSLRECSPLFEGQTFKALCEAVQAIPYGLTLPSTVFTISGQAQLSASAEVQQ